MEDSTLMLGIALGAYGSDLLSSMLPGMSRRNVSIKLLPTMATFCEFRSSFHVKAFAP